MQGHYRSIDTFDILSFDTYLKLFRCGCGCGKSNINMLLFRSLSIFFNNIHSTNMKFKIIASYNCSSELEHQRKGNAIYMKLVGPDGSPIDINKFIGYAPEGLSIAEKGGVVRFLFTN